MIPQNAVLTSTTFPQAGSFREGGSCVILGQRWQYVRSTGLGDRRQRRPATPNYCRSPLSPRAVQFYPTPA